MNKHEAITCGIFYCRVSAEINYCGSLQTSSRFDSDVLRNRQQKHTAKPLGNIQRKPTAQTAHLVFADKKANAEKPKELFFANARTE